MCINPTALARPAGSALVPLPCRQRALFLQGDVGIVPAVLAAGSSVVPEVLVQATGIAPRCRQQQRAMPHGAGSSNRHCPTALAALPWHAGPRGPCLPSSWLQRVRRPSPPCCWALPVPRCLCHAARQLRPGPAFGGSLQWPRGERHRAPVLSVLLPSPRARQSPSRLCWLPARAGSLPVPVPCPCRPATTAGAAPRGHAASPGAPRSPLRPAVLGAIADGTNASASPEGPAPLPLPSAHGHRPLGATACSARRGLGTLLPAPGAQQVTNIRSPPGWTGP